MLFRVIVFFCAWFMMGYWPEYMLLFKHLLLFWLLISRLFLHFSNVKRPQSLRVCELLWEAGVASGSNLDILAGFLPIYRDAHDMDTCWDAGMSSPYITPITLSFASCMCFCVTC